MIIYIFNLGQVMNIFFMKKNMELEIIEEEVGVQLEKQPAELLQVQ